MPATGPERIRRRDGQDAAGTDAIGAGRHRDQAKRTVAADGLPVADEGGFAVAEWRRAENRRAPVPTARPTAPAAERSDAKCAGPGSDRSRTQSRDCGAGRAQCGTVHFARAYRWGGGPRTLTGTVHTAPHDTHGTARTPHAICPQFTNAVHRLQNGTAVVPKRAQRKMSAMMDILRFTSITIAKSARISASGRKMNVPSAAPPHTLSAQNR